MAAVGGVHTIYTGLYWLLSLAEGKYIELWTAQQQQQWRVAMIICSSLYPIQCSSLYPNCGTVTLMNAPLKKERQIVRASIFSSSSFFRGKKVFLFWTRTYCLEENINDTAAINTCTYLHSLQYIFSSCRGESQSVCLCVCMYLRS